MRQMKTITRVLCPISRSTTDEVCQALNKVVPEIERTHGTIDLDSIEMHHDGDVLVLAVCVPSEERPDRPVEGSTAF